MMAAKTNILREYLFALGFKVDDQQFKKIQEVVKTTTDVLEDLALTTAEIAEITDKAVIQMADRYAELYYQAGRIGTTVRGLQNFQTAARMVGISGEAAASGLESLARTLRMNPGLVGYLNALGVKTQGRKTEDIELDLLSRLQRMAPYIRDQIAQNFGLDPDEVEQMMRNGGLQRMQEARNEREQMLRKAGLDPDKVAQNSVEFNRDIIRMETSIEILQAIILDRFLPVVEPFVKAFAWIVEHAAEADRVTHGTTTYVGGVGAVVLSWLASKGLLKMARRLLGKTVKGGAGETAGEVAGEEAAVGVGEAVAGEGAVAGGGALLAFAPEIAIIVGAVLGILGLGWVIDKLASEKGEEIGRTIKADAIKTGHAIARAFQATKNAVHGWISPTAVEAAAAEAEGVRRIPYIAPEGKSTVGIGHQIRPGEKFDHPLSDAEIQALYDRDMNEKRAQVDRLTKGLTLTPGQREALADFQFTGANLAKSSILRLMRSGDFAGAAKAFELYNGYHDAQGRWHTSQSIINRRLGEEAMFKGGVTIHQETKIQVSSPDPAAAARATVREQRGVNQDLVRHAVGVPN